MQHLLPILCFALVLVPVDKAAEDDQKAIQGIWVVVKAERSGRDNIQRYDGVQLVFSSDSFSMIDKEGKSVFKCKFVLVTAKKPKAIDMTIMETLGENDKKLIGKTVKGIYRFEGDRLKWCTTVPGKPRPESFMTEKDGDRSLMVLKRKK